MAFRDKKPTLREATAQAADAEAMAQDLAESAAVENVPTPTQTPTVESTALVDTDSELKTLARKIRSAKRKAVEAILVIGESLTEANRLLADHAGGSFGKWLSQEAEISRSSAHRYMQAYALLGSRPAVEQRCFELQAVHVLADNSTPRQAVDDCLTMAAEGSQVTAATVRQVIASYKSPSEKAADDRPAPQIFTTPSGRVVVHPTHEFSSIEAVLLDALAQVKKVAA